MPGSAAFSDDANAVAASAVEDWTTKVRRETRVDFMRELNPPSRRAKSILAGAAGFVELADNACPPWHNWRMSSRFCTCASSNQQFPS